MYLHLGNNILVKTDDVIAIFDLENASIAKSTKRYLALAQKKGWVVNVTMEMPKSFVVCSHRDTGDTKVYISQISSSTLRKRTGFLEDISNI